MWLWQIYYLMLRRDYRLICMDTSGSLWKDLYDATAAADQEIYHPTWHIGSTFLYFKHFHHILILENTLKVFQGVKDDGKAVF